MVENNTVFFPSFLGGINVFWLKYEHNVLYLIHLNRNKVIKVVFSIESSLSCFRQRGACSFPLSLSKIPWGSPSAQECDLVVGSTKHGVTESQGFNHRGICIVLLLCSAEPRR